MEVLAEIGHKIGFDWRLALTHFFNFALIFILLVKFALPNIKKVIEERNKKIQEGLTMRENAGHLVEEANKNAKDIVRDANEKVNILLAQAGNTSVEIINSATEKGKDILANAEIEKNKAKAKGLLEAENLLASSIDNIITKVSENAFGEKITSENNSVFVRDIFQNKFNK